MSVALPKIFCLFFEKDILYGFLFMKIVTSYLSVSLLNHRLELKVESTL
jgi:hypothetical protein